jgi:solute:Na+ symporter, SSS family
MGLTGTGLLGDLPLIIAFVILAAYTYSSGLRAPALIALVKDALIYIAVLVIVIAVPMQLGGFGAIFAKIPAAKLTLASDLSKGNSTWAFGTLALGSALALFLYPHSITGTLSSKSSQVVKRNAALLPAYSFLLGLIALAGFMAIAGGIQIGGTVHGIKIATANYAVPGLILKFFPDWFVGIAFAAIAIGALVPAAVMSIAAANLFTRNIYKEFIRPNLSHSEESTVVKITSLVVKFGALLFVLLYGTQYTVNFQLLGGVWILQTLPPVILALYTRWFNRWALLAGWVIGMLYGTNVAFGLNFKAQTYALHLPGFLGGSILNGFTALYALIVNLAVATVLSLVFNLLHVPNGKDSTQPADYDEVMESSNVVTSISGTPALAEE